MFYTPKNLNGAAGTAVQKHEPAGRRPRHLAALLLLCGLVLPGFGLQKASAQSAAAGRPWYAARLEALGFTVFKEPVAIKDFKLTPLGAGADSLAALKGKVVLLNFWATWCPPCRAEMPAIQKLWDKTKDRPFAIVAISSGEASVEVAGFIAQNGYSYPVYLDKSGEIGSAFGVRSIPTTYIVDKQGKVIAGTVGGLAYDSAAALALFAELASK